MSASGNDLAAIARRLDVSGRLLEVRPYGTGHINDTWLTTWEQPAGTLRIILQRLNTTVFRRPELVTENILRVTRHMRARLEAEGEHEPDRRVVRLVPDREGRHGWRDEAGNYWRAMHFIAGAVSQSTLTDPAWVEEGARTVAEFHRLLSDLPGPRLHETIPDFHNTPRRFTSLVEAVERDPRNRASGCAAEIEFLLGLREEAGLLDRLAAEGRLRERATHNDAKLDNVLFDQISGRGICLIDLDTLMPGFVLNDFGDMVRSMTCLAGEDATDLERVQMEPALFEALLRGFLTAAAGVLSPLERELLPFAGKLITLEQAVRFLDDHLRGDVYYKIHREGHNLDRARNQIALVRSIIRQEEGMNRLLARLLVETPA